MKHTKKGVWTLAIAAAILLLSAIGYWQSSALANLFRSPYLHPLGGTGYQF